MRDIEHLLLSDFSNGIRCRVLNDHTLIDYFTGCRKLRSITLAGIFNGLCQLTNRSMGMLSYLEPNLEQLYFIKAQKIDDETLSIFAALPNLQVLHMCGMSGFTNSGVAIFAKHSSKCRDFRIDFCEGITEDIIESWINAAKARPADRITLTLVGIRVERNIKDIPKNLIINIY